MKKTLGLLFFLLIGVISAACSNETIKTEDVEKLVKEYKAEQYNFKDPNNIPSGIEIGDKVKKYLSKGTFEKLNANQVFQIAPEFVKITKKTIELEDVFLEKEKEMDDGSIDYKYTLKLKVSDEQSSEVIEKKGQLTVLNAGDLLITRDWENKVIVDGVPI
ncbi:hypothetical protein [Neobacillus sp. YIM B06451]|uniref:hypothetical protein n=1 Tax=Neobacillus sp. YIM B06451 TaxID=3070994 RepID=UPI00292E6E21|nr:hypothetical protein [Neobacillus sp. YIM B06451]